VLFRRDYRSVTEPCGLGYRELQRLTDEELMRHLVAGHDDALTCLFERYHRLVLSIARRVLRDEDEAQDLVQDVFFNLCRTVAKFDPQKGTTKMWIIRGAYRQCLTRRRYLKLRGWYESVPPVEATNEAPGAGLLTPESSRLVRELLAQLNRPQRETLQAAVFEGMTTQEIAVKTGETLSNVRHHYYRGLSKLRAMLLQKPRAVEPATNQEAVNARS